MNQWITCKHSVLTSSLLLLTCNLVFVSSFIGCTQERNSCDPFPKLRPSKWYLYLLASLCSTGSPRGNLCDILSSAKTKTKKLLTQIKVRVFGYKYIYLRWEVTCITNQIQCEWPFQVENKSKGSITRQVDEIGMSNIKNNETYIWIRMDDK